MATASPLAKARRHTELSLVVMAGLITAGAYTVASLGQFTRIPARIVPFLLTLLGMLLLAHLAVRWFARGADPTILPLAAMLHGIGYVMITRIDERLAGLQATWSILAIVGFVLTLVVVERAPNLARYRWTFLALGIGLLLMPLVPGLGASFGGARIWVSIGPVNFQPGEFAKIALAIFFASYLADNRQLIASGTWKVGPLRLPELRYLLPVAGAWAFAVLVMVAEKDLGSSLLFFTLFVVMLWVATEKVAYLVIGAVSFALAAFISWQLFTHVQLRVDIWLDPWADRNDEGFQLVQAIYGMADGGLIGTGLGRGSPDVVPVAESDFIFTSIAEELGLFGSTGVLIAFVLLVGAGLRIALRTENAFEKLLAIGLTTTLAVQTFIIVGGVIKLIPLTGVTLPFVSYGGSSLLSNYIVLALLIRLSDSTARRLHEVPDDPTPAERWAARRLRRRRRRDAKRMAVASSAVVGAAGAGPARRDRGHAVNRRIRQLAVGLMTCFVLLFVAMNYWHVGRESDVNAMVDNTRAIRREFGSPRGEIISRDGVVLARSVPSPDGSDFPFQREYPTGELFADLTGYYTFPFGATQVEFTQNDVLTGDTARQRIGNLNDIVTGGDGTGSVRLTLDYDLQALAQQQLEGYQGSIVVIDTQTGAVLAMYSNPSYDPNRVASLDFDAAGAYLEELLNTAGNPLLAEAYQEREMPGSTFKVITTSIGLDMGTVTMDSYWEPASEWTPPQTTDPIENYNGTTCGGSLLEVFTRSCNIPFARMAVENIGVDGFIAGTDAWGIGEPIPIDLPRPAASTVGDTTNLAENLPLLAMRGFGQNDDQMVPMHMAMVAATVANGGVMVRPYVVDATLDSDGEPLTVTPGGQEWITPTTPETAATLNTLMQSVATNGTASCCIALDSGHSVAAKTGTAQLNGPDEPERSNAWIVAFAPADQPRYAVAVVILGTNAEISASTGGRLAGPIARRMLDAAFAEDL